MTYPPDCDHYNGHQPSPNMFYNDNVDDVNDQRAQLPDYHDDRPSENDDCREELIWKPNPERIDDNAVDAFIRQAFDLGMNSDVALYLLYTCNYDNNVALNIIRNGDNNRIRIS